MSEQANSRLSGKKWILAGIGAVILAGAWWLFRPEKLWVNVKVNEAAPFAASGDLQPLYTGLASNVKLYPKFQEYFRAFKPPLLAIWGKNDPFFVPAGAEAFRKDLPDAQIQFLDTGHFALETHVIEIAAAMKDFLQSVRQGSVSESSR